MYQASEQFNTAILGDNRTFRAKLKSGGTEITSGIISIKQYAQSSSETITIGGAMSAYVEIQMWKPDVQLEGNEIEISIGLMVDGKLEYVPLGLFNVQKPEDDDGVISFTGYDRIQSKMGGAYSSELAYPADGKSVLAEISSKTGVPIDTSSLQDGVMINERVSCEESDVDEYGEPVVNVTYVKPFNGYTYRDALGYIAQLYGKFASVNRSGTVVFRWYQEVDYEINQDRYYDDLIVAEHVFSVGAISCKVGEQVLHSGTGTASIQMENPVMTQDLLDSVYQQIKDIQFIPSSLSFYGDARLDLGDIVTVNDKRGNVIKVPVMQISQDFDGGLLSNVQSFGGTLSDDNNKGPTERKLDQIYTDLFLVKELVGNKANFKLAYDLSVSVSGHTEQLNVQSGRIDSLSDRTTELEFGATGIKTTVSEIRTDLSGTQAKLNTVESQANQAADHISWIVKSGTSATDFTLTDRTAQLITDSLVIKDSTGASTIISGGKMDINQIFAQDITATGTIRGVTIIGGEITTENYKDNLRIKDSEILSNAIYSFTNQDGSIYDSGKTYARLKSGEIEFGSSSDTGKTYNSVFLRHATESDTLAIMGNTDFYGNINIEGNINTNSLYATGWLCSFGNNGWWNKTYGGGIYMNDTNSVKVYNNKSFYCANEIRAGLGGSGQFRAVAGNYGFFIRNDGANTYFMLTNSGDEYGLWNDLRPLYINNTTGNVSISKVNIPTKGNTWIGGGMNGDNVAIKISTKQGTDLYHPFLYVQSSSGHHWNMGGIADYVGVYGFYSNQTTNAANYYTRWNTSSGMLEHLGEFKVNGTVHLGTGNQTVYFSGDRIAVTTYGNLRTTADNSQALGTSDYRWSKVYAANGTIQTSDEREKDILGEIDDRYLKFFSEAEPVLYRWRYGDDKRIRVGIGAQSAEAALKASGLSLQQYAGIEHDYFDAPTANGLTDRYSMDYTMYCLLASEQTKRNTRAIDALKSEHLSHDAQIASLQQQLIDAGQQIAEQAAEIAQLRGMIGTA